MKGTRPRGVNTEPEAARWVREMFGRVAGRYDLLNHLLSLNMDRYWRARTARRLRSLLRRPDSRVMDICCGTGDLMLAIERALGVPVVGSDFSRPMLTAAQRKIGRNQSRSVLVEADALGLPLADGALDLITVGFGFRNFSSYPDGLREMRRVLKPGGVAAILEFSRPPNRLFAAAYDFYSLRVLPWLGGLISGSPEAYRYLPESVRNFPDAPRLAEVMRESGFENVNFEYMTLGIVALHLGTGG